MRLREYLTLVFLVDQLGLVGTLCCYAGQAEPASGGTDHPKWIGWRSHRTLAGNGRQS